LYLNNYGSELKVADYDTSIVFDKYSPEQVVLSDPNGLIESYNFRIIEIDAYNFKITYDLTFSQPVDTTNFYVTTWDLDKNPGYKTFEDVLKITYSEELPDEIIFEKETIIENNDVSSDSDASLSVDSSTNPSDGGFGGILTPTDSEEPKFDMVFEKKAESIVTPKTVCRDGTVLKNEICVLDITKQESKPNTNTLSILVGIFLLEAILGILIIIIFMKRRRKKHPDIPKYPLKLDK